MKRLLYIFILLSLPLSLTADPFQDRYKDIKYLELDNGLKVYVLADDQAVNSQIAVDVNVGTEAETRQTAGLSHLLEHLMFRDQRIPHKDYLDYLNEGGATYVNGYTQRYKTQYVATIDSDKAYWLVGIFSQMLFDKSITNEDLFVEQRALQTEIGEYQWYHPLINAVSLFFGGISDLFPDQPNIHRDDFGLAPEKELPSEYYYLRNNKNFTLKDVMHHYETYYYPANMTLKIVGNFDADKMVETIQKNFAHIANKKGKTVTEPPMNATMKTGPFEMFYSGGSTESTAHVGAKFLFKDYRTYLIVDSYVEHLATRMQQLLRNKLGQTYSINSYQSYDRGAALAGVSFSSLHDAFKSNLNAILTQVQQDRTSMDLNEIREALRQSRLNYTTIEHDSDSLLSLVETEEYLHTHHEIYDQTPYEIFASITPDLFQNTINRIFVPENRFSYIVYDYYLFPYDSSLLSVLFLILFLVVYFKLHRYLLARRDISYTQRDIMFSRRLSNRFLSFLHFLFLLVVAILLSEWSEQLLFQFFFGDPYYHYRLSQPMAYLYMIPSFACFLAIWLVLATTTLRLFKRLDITQNRLSLIGTSIMSFTKEEIEEIKKVTWSINKMTKTQGIAILFYKPLVMIKTSKDQTLYLRAKNASELEEDLRDWKNTEDSVDRN